MDAKIKSSPLVKKLKAACFPDYKGRKYRVSTDVPKNLDSYWDGGTKRSYVFYDAVTGKTLPVSSNHPFFEKDNPRYLSKLPNGCVLVEHTYFCGHNLGLTFYVNEEDIVKLLP
jgi:hypothetical protein